VPPPYLRATSREAEVDIGAISVPPNSLNLSMSSVMSFIPRQSHLILLNSAPSIVACGFRVERLGIRVQSLGLGFGDHTSGFRLRVNAGQ